MGFILALPELPNLEPLQANAGGGGRQCHN